MDQTSVGLNALPKLLLIVAVGPISCQEYPNVCSATRPVSCVQFLSFVHTTSRCIQHDENPRSRGQLRKTRTRKRGRGRVYESNSDVEEDFIVDESSRGTATPCRRDVPWIATTDVEAVTSLKAPFTSILFQPAQWIRVPDGEPPPVLLSSKHAFSSSSTPRPPVADPFSVPDNDYHDSWLDRLWINLFSDRMLAAVEGIQAGERGFRGQEGGDSPAGARAGADVGVAGSLDGEEEARARKSPRGVSNGRRISSERGSNARGSYTYEDYVTLAKRLQAGTPEGQRRVVRGILLSVFPGWFPALFRALFPPGKLSAQINAFMCPHLFTWLVGRSAPTHGVVNLERADGTPAGQEMWLNTVKVERCRFLEASKCKGACINLCKLPTEGFFKEDLGLPLRMTPNFEDLSCEFAFGQAATPVEDDPLMREPCWTECVTSSRRLRPSATACHTMPETPLKR